MKRFFVLLCILAAGLLLASTAGAASGCTVASYLADAYSDGLGEHSIIRITVTQTGTTFSFTSSDFIEAVGRKHKGYIYWIGIDATGTLDAAPQLTITDRFGFTQFSDTTSFHVSNPIKVTGNSYDGQYTHVTDRATWSFNDVGTSEVLVIYVDLVR